jgi:hypothetical protein
MDGAVISVCARLVEGIIEAPAGGKPAGIKEAIVAGHGMPYQIAVDPGDGRSCRNRQAAWPKGCILDYDRIRRHLALIEQAGYSLSTGASQEHKHCQTKYLPFPSQNNHLTVIQV